MRTYFSAALLVAVMAGMIPTVKAQYAPYFTDPLTSIDTTKWYSNGSLSADSSGLTSSATGGGSLISQVPVPTYRNGVPYYEVRGTLNIQQSGGAWTFYLHASNDALAGPNASGSFYAVEFSDPSVSGGVCSSITLTVYKRVNGVVTQMMTGQIPCHNGMVARAVIGNSNQIAVYADDLWYYWAQDQDLQSGQPGVGVRNLPAANTMTAAQLGPNDMDPPPPIDPATVSVSPFPNRVEMQWKGIVDAPNGTGVMMYQVQRNGSFLVNSRGMPGLVDPSALPGQTYQYTIYAADYHFNWASPVTITVKTPPAGAIDPRQVGVRPNGTYWGGAGEQIDMRSGNLNFTIPLLRPQGRGGWSVPVMLSYNSQNWRQDDGQSVWKMGKDSGYGFGWKLQAGSLTPIYRDYWNIALYVFTDATGAEYRLDTVSPSGVWTSKESVYVSYDPGANKLYFRDGTNWTMGSASGGTEEDAGTLYPTVMQDTNGNQIFFRYNAGLGLPGPNTSSRISEIEDVRAVGAPGSYKTYAFTYGATYGGDPIPHLTGINDLLGSGEGYSMSYFGNQPQRDPFTGAVWGNPQQTVALIYDLVRNGNTNQKYHFDYSSPGWEMSKVTYPNLGYTRWTYNTATFTQPSNPTGPGRSIREVNYRYIAYSAGAAEKTFQLERDGGDTTNGRFVHWKARVHDVAAGTLLTPNNQGDVMKVWLFNYDPNVWNIGLPYQLVEKAATASYYHHYYDYTWAQETNTGNTYLSALQENFDMTAATWPKGSAAKRTEQTIDANGNVLTTKLYDFAPGSSDPQTTPSRTYTNTYLTDPAYTSRYILNRLVSTQLFDGSTTLTLVTNSYDNYGGSLFPVPSGAREHDDANYGTTFYLRGNLTSRAQFGVTTNLTYDATGAVQNGSDTTGKTFSATALPATNYAAPSSITANNLSTSLNWNGALQLTQETGPNGDSTGFSYFGDGRTYQVSSPYGAQGSYSYDDAAHTKTFTVNGRSSKTTYDGFGRAVKVEVADSTGVKSVVDTQYDACGCTPMGKVVAVSQPHASGAAPVFTQYKYDDLGRTVSVIAADGASTTSYVYFANTVKITDAKGKWKKLTMDAFGNVIQVDEPKPGTNGASLYTTNYTYDVLNRLRQVTMPRDGVTQTRTWTYDSTYQLLSSTNLPETGVTQYFYRTTAPNNDLKLDHKIDAKGQRTDYVYETGPAKRVIQVKHTPGGSEDVCQQVNYTYDSNPVLPSFGQNLSGRLAMVQYFIGPQGTSCSTGAGQVSEMYSYHAGGAMLNKKFRYQRRIQTIADLDVSMGYDNEGRMSSLTYPNGGQAVSYSYDSLGRLGGMTDALNNPLVSGVQYGPANELLQISWGATETRTYNAMLQMTRLQISTNSKLLDESYNYPAAGSNNGRIDSKTDNIAGETVAYTYDDLNRLVSATATGGTSPWARSWSYDGFGNRLTQNVGGATTYFTYNGVNQLTGLGNTANYYQYDANGNMTGVGPFASIQAFTFDVENRMASAQSSSTAGFDSYGYAADNKRVYKKRGDDGTEEVSFYLGNKKLGVYQVNDDGFNPFQFTTLSTQLWFGGKKLAVRDRLGSKGGYYPFGEERGSAVQNDDSFATYYRDKTTGVDYADQRYYSAAIGRFVTPDPAGTAAVNVQDPTTWNNYLYVGGDPINLNDPTGLEGNPYDTCMINGVTYPFSCSDMVSGFRPPPRQTAWDRTLARLSAAQEGLADRSTVSADCQKDLDALSVAAGQAIDLAAIQDALSRTSFENGTISKLPVSALYGPGAEAAGAAFQSQEDAKYGPGQTISNEFRRNPDGLTAVTVLFGSTMFINPDLIGNNLNGNMALLFHESLHELGLVDSTIQSALGLTVDDQNTKNITIKLQKDCVTGKGNR